MSDDPEERDQIAKPNGLSESVASKETRKLQARSEADRTIWMGVGAFGVIGWSIAVPTLAGIAIGIWLDRHWGGRSSWTLTLLLAGVTLGCVSAWIWISNERADVDKNRKGPAS